MSRNFFRVLVSLFVNGSRLVMAVLPSGIVASLNCSVASIKSSTSAERSSTLSLTDFFLNMRKRPSTFGFLSLSNSICGFCKILWSLIDASLMLSFLEDPPAIEALRRSLSFALTLGKSLRAICSMRRLLIFAIRLSITSFSPGERSAYLLFLANFTLKIFIAAFLALRFNTSCEAVLLAAFSLPRLILKRAFLIEIPRLRLCIRSSTSSKTSASSFIEGFIALATLSMISCAFDLRPDGKPLANFLRSPA